MRSKQNPRSKKARRARQIRTMICLACACVILLGAIYTAAWIQNRNRIEREALLYREMYAPASEDATPSPAATASPTTSAGPSSDSNATNPPTDAGPSPAIASAANADATDLPSDAETMGLSPSNADAADLPSDAEATGLSPSDIEAASPSSDADAMASPSDDGAADVQPEWPEVSDQPIPTPDAETKVLALPTTPPAQDSFEALLAYNPDTVGYLQIDDFVSLPVVQRENDNEYYLTHTFAGAEGAEGTLFLDGLNRLVPEDDCLIVYGHNMQNGTMFGDLKLYLDLNYLRSAPLVRFDTIYENRSYAPFAAFTASMDPESATYFDVRQFIFNADAFDRFVSSLRSRSCCDIPLDVQYGDRLLLLVTCDSSHSDGRMILALRALREGEDAEDVAALVAQAE